MKETLWVRSQRGRSLQSGAVALLTVLAISAAACTEAGPSTTLSNVAVSFSTQGTRVQPVAPDASIFRSLFLVDTLTDGSGNNLVITSAEMVLRQIELKRAEVADCDIVPEPDGCKEFAVGPLLIDLPLTAGAQRQVEIQIDPGTYTQIDFEIHKVSGDEEDRLFVAAHPEFEDLSIRVRGEFNGNPFEFTSDLDVEQELPLQPNLVLSSDVPGATNVTIQTDVDTWFRTAGGTLVDPGSGNKGELNEGLVKDNIKDSFHAFEDEDEDGSD